MNNWNQVSLQEVCKITRGASPRPIKDWITNDLNGIPWVKIRDATSSKTRFIKHTSEMIKQEGISKSVSVVPGDLIVSNSATPGLPKFMDINACIHDGWLLIREFDDIDKEFLYYLLINDRKYLVSQGTGTVFTNLKTDILKNHIIQLPNIKVQKIIASFLSKLDSKIELNQKINETLEEIAKTLFKSWFIDFDPVRAKAEGRPTGLSKEISDLFPDSFEDSELGEIPKGWTINKIKDLGKVICGKTPPTKDKENYGDGFNFITIPDMHDQVFVLESSKTVTEKGTKTLKGKLLPEKTICVSCIATPGLTVIIDKPSFTNQQINSITPYAEHLSYFLFLNFRTLGSKISIYGGGGSVFENMSKSKFEEILIKTPDEKILKYFENHLSPIFEKILITTKENKILTEIRDTLLPKLISGELQIPSAENLIEEAGI